MIVCDNTLLGPIFQKPLAHGADISIYSLTKYVGGHSDLVAGAASEPARVLRPVRMLRAAIGTQLDPHSCWMIGRSLETLSLRMNAACRNAEVAARYLSLTGASPRSIFRPSCRMAARRGGSSRRNAPPPARPSRSTSRAARPRPSAFLNALHIFKLAVSLGGTESLACHPASTTHSGVPKEVRDRIGVTDATIRVSIGIEHPDDIVADLTQALAKVD